ncbi:MAG: M14 family zinc carboxypeptidase [Candidatus Saccharibacteria bacterium]
MLSRTPQINRAITVLVSLFILFGIQVSVMAQVPIIGQNSEPTVTNPPALHISTPNKTYSFVDMTSDLAALKTAYPELITVQVIGSSVGQRPIYAVKLGHGEKKIFINASFHGREWITSCLTLQMIACYAESAANSRAIDGYHVKEYLETVSIWFIPMVNPDGVTISQSRNRSWKANQNGVDLNRQFSYGWTEGGGPKRPGPEGFKGYSSMSEPEARALADFVYQHDFLALINYHSAGEIIYSDAKFVSADKRQEAQDLKQLIFRATKYRPGSQETENRAAGYFKDYFAVHTKNPSYTIEVGKAKYAGCSVPISELPRIWAQNKLVPLGILKYYYEK